MVRGLKFGIKKEKRLYYLCSENKGADPLLLQLCFPKCKKAGFFHDAAHMLQTTFRIKISVSGDNLRNEKIIISLCLLIDHWGDLSTFSRHCPELH